MASLKIAAAACVAAMTFVHAFATGPQPDEGEIAVSLNETVLIELARQADRKFKAVLLDSTSGKHPHILFHLSGDGSRRMLKVKNHYEQALKYAARVCKKEHNHCSDTSVLTVRAGLSAFEIWVDPIDLLVLSKFSLE